MKNCFSLRPIGEWNNKGEIIFNLNKAALQMEIIEFKEELFIKQILIKFLTLL